MYAFIDVRIICIVRFTVDLNFPNFHLAGSKKLAELIPFSYVLRNKQLMFQVSTAPSPGYGRTFFLCVPT